MAIDGRRIADKETKPAAASHDAPWITALAWAAVIVPLGLLVAGTYVIGTWTGGVIGGVVSVVSTLVLCGAVWGFRRSRRK